MFVGFVKNTAGNKNLYCDKLLAFTHQRNMRLDKLVFGDEVGVDALLSELEKNGSALIINDIACLGNSLASVGNNLLYCKGAQIDVFTVEDNFCFKWNELSDDFFRGFDIAVDVRKRLVSGSIRRTLEHKKALGVPLGRVKGCYVRRRLDGKESEICGFLKQKVPLSKIAIKYGVSRATLYNFLREKNIGYR